MIMGRSGPAGLVQHAVDLAAVETGELRDLARAEAGGGQPADDGAELVATGAHLLREPAELLLLALQLDRRADRAHGVVEEHGQEPVAGVAAAGVDHAVRRLPGPGPGRQGLLDGRGDGPAGPRRLRPRLLDFRLLGTHGLE